MKLTTLSDRLLLAITTEKQDAIRNGTDGSPRVSQRIGAMEDAIAVIELAEAQARKLIGERPKDPRPPRRLRDWIDGWKHGGDR